MTADPRARHRAAIAEPARCQQEFRRGLGADRHRPRRPCRRGRRARRRQRRRQVDAGQGARRRPPADSGTITFSGKEVPIHDPSAALHLGIATVFQDLALCENLDVVGNIFLGREIGPWRLDEVAMEVRAWTLLQQLSAQIPSVRVPIASLSGGQRQTVAIARSLLGDPSVIMLDEPTAALGVAQTAEVLDLIERLRERGLGVIMISHNMEDVRAVADRIVVLRLGRNNGDLRRPTSVRRTGRRDHRRHRQRRVAARGAHPARGRQCAPLHRPKKEDGPDEYAAAGDVARPDRRAAPPTAGACAGRWSPSGAACAPATSARCRSSSAW